MTGRRTPPERRPALRALWARVFGDSEAEIDALAEPLGLWDRCAALWDDGRPAAAAYWYETGCLRVSGAADAAAGVLYAVAAEPALRGRGYGAEASRRAWADMASGGMAVRLTVPAEPGLFGYYARFLGAQTAFYALETPLTGAPGRAEVRRVDAETYGRIREERLRGRTHLVFSSGCLKLQERLCASSGGGLFAFGGGCFSLERTETGVLAAELLADDRDAGLDAVRAAAGGADGLVRMPAETPAGEGVRPFAMADRKMNLSPAPPWFGFAFD